MASLGHNELTIGKACAICEDSIAWILLDYAYAMTEKSPLCEDYNAHVDVYPSETYHTHKSVETPFVHVNLN